MKDLNQVITLNPKYGWAYFHRGWTLLKMRQQQQAVESFSSAIALNPEEDWWLYSRAVAYRTLNLNSEADTDLKKAIQLMEKTCAQNPSDS
ncbi:MAG TPA: tetratricopeptide repeat protein [Leptolyngbyaceae cyanobacterium]